MQTWLVTLIQQFGREVITGAPDAAKAGRRELHNLRDPYVDNWVYWMGRGGEWELDVADHRRYDELTAAQKVRLSELQLAGKLGRYNHTKPKHRRPWTAAANASVQD